MDDNPFESIGREFKRAAEKSALRFRRRVQRAVAKLRNAPDRAAEERIQAEIGRATVQYEAEMERHRAQLEAALARAAARYKGRIPPPPRAHPPRPPVPPVVRPPIDRRGLESSPGKIETADEEIRLLRKELSELRGSRLRWSRRRKIPPITSRLEWLLMERLRKPPRRRPPDDDGGIEPAPVKPRPNPTPLIDGAEAPIE